MATEKLERRIAELERVVDRLVDVYNAHDHGTGSGVHVAHGPLPKSPERRLEGGD